MKNSKMKTCCICGQQFTEPGNNPFPIKGEGECCRNCNWTVVLPERFRRINSKNRNGFNKTTMCGTALEQINGESDHRRSETVAQHGEQLRDRGDVPEPERVVAKAQEVTNFARFYASFNRLPYTGDKETTKQDIVMQWTGNRTGSLREMTRVEYEACCEALERLTGRKDEQKKLRSRSLRLMQQLGIDTTDWTRINSFCQDRRIAGKPFARLTNEELETLSVKLRTMQRNGGLKLRKTENEHPKRSGITLYIPMDANAPKC